MSIETSPFTKNWALNWVKGSIVSYLRGNTPVNIVKGRIKRAVESYGVKARGDRSYHKLTTNRPLTNNSERA